MRLLAKCLFLQYEFTNSLVNIDNISCLIRMEDSRDILVWCVKGIEFASFAHFCIRFLSYSDGVVYLVFYFII
jgi:hypothetical protein